MEIFLDIGQVKPLFIRTWIGSHHNFEPINICVDIYNIEGSSGLNTHFDKNQLPHLRYFEHTEALSRVCCSVCKSFMKIWGSEFSSSVNQSAFPLPWG